VLLSGGMKAFITELGD